MSALHAVALNDDLLRGLEERVHALMAEHHVPGVAVGLLRGENRHVLTFGVTSVEHPLPVTDQTFFLMGSIGKTYTATLVMRLIEEGKLSLDTPVLDVVPELELADAGAAHALTVRHLLTHSGGWWNQDDEATGDGDDALERHIHKLREVPQVFPPGEQFSYSNSGFNLLGRVIEKVTGKTYEAAITELLLEPLNLHETLIFPVDVMTRRFAVGHEQLGDETRVVRPWTLPRAGNASGGLSASVQDVLNYVAFHLKGGAYLRPETMKAMQSPQIKVDDAAHGFPWHVEERGTVQVRSHAGGMPGQQSLLWFIPELNVACAILTNSYGGAHLHGAVTDWLQERWLKLPSTPPATFTATVNFSEYVGLYRPSHLPEGYMVSSMVNPENPRQPEQLALYSFNLDEPGEQERLGRLEFVGTDHAVLADAPHLGRIDHRFLRDPSGKVAYMRFFGRIVPLDGHFQVSAGQDSAGEESVGEVTDASPSS